MRKYLPLLLLLFAPLSSAQTINAASCSQHDVVVALGAITTDGTTVVLPACSNFIWGPTSAFSSGSANVNAQGSVFANSLNSFTIQGAGAISATTGGANITGSDLTSIVNHVSGGGPTLVVSPIAGKTLRVTGIAFLEDSGSTSQQSSAQLAIYGQSSAVRVDHCHFFINAGGSKGLFFGGGVTGVTDHIYVNTTQTVTNDVSFDNGQRWKAGNDPNGFGNSSWNDIDNWGTSQFMFVEDSQINGGYVGDCSAGGRYVIRHSTIVNTFGMEQHGTHTEYRSCRASEFYLNNVTLPATCPYAPNGCIDSGGVLHNNGGPTLLWGNAIGALIGSQGSGSGFYYAIDTANSRTSENYGPGTSPFPPAGFGLCGTGKVQYNGSGQQIGFMDSPWDGNQNTSTGYPCLDQAGVGKGDLLAGAVPPDGSGICNLTLNPACNNFSGQWPRQAIDPLYIWANTASSGTFVAIAGGGDGLITDNRDYYQQFGPGGVGEPGSFNGTVGVGQGSVTPTTAGAYPGSPNCTAGAGGNTPGVGWWNTNNNTLYVCTATNTWTTYYTPFTYPHPLAGGTPPPPVVANPTCLPASGGPPQTVTCTDSTPSAKMCYRTDGVAPTAPTPGTCGTGSTTYSGSILISVNPTTLQILGTLAGDVNSSVVAFTYGSPAVSLTPSSMTFSTNKGVTSPIQIATLQNTGGTALTVTSAATSNLYNFSAGSIPCGPVPFNLAAGATCTFSITFSPTTTGVVNGTFSITDNAAGSPHIITLTGTGTAPAISLTPASYTYPNVSLGSSVVSPHFTLTNTGNGPLNVSFTIGGTNPSNFHVVTQGIIPACPGVLAAGASCDVAASFTPLSAGSFSATLVETDSVQSINGSSALNGTATSIVTAPVPQLLQ